MGASRRGGRGQLVQRQVDRRPDVEEDPVGLGAPRARGAPPGRGGCPRGTPPGCARPRAARQRPVGGPQRRQVANLGQRDESLVLGRLRGRCSGRGTCRRRRTAARSRSKRRAARSAAGGRSSGEGRGPPAPRRSRPRARAEGELAVSPLPGTPPRRRGGAPAVSGGAGRRDPLRQVGRQGVGVRPARAPVEVEVDDAAVRVRQPPRRTSATVAGHVRRSRRAPAERRHQPHPPLGRGVVEGGHEVAAVPRSTRGRPGGCGSCSSAGSGSRASARAGRSRRAMRSPRSRQQRLRGWRPPRP